MREFLQRQFCLIRKTVEEYRGSLLTLNKFIQRIEALGTVIGGDFWEGKLFEAVLELERINSELIDKNRSIKFDEQEAVKKILSRIESIVAG
jgi:hypothetical protein